MTPFHQLLNMKVDWGHVCKGFGSPNRTGLESASDPEAHMPLHLAERIKGAFHSGALIEPLYVLSLDMCLFGPTMTGSYHIRTFTPPALVVSPP
jgi:hypothetical protein